MTPTITVLEASALAALVGLLTFGVGLVVAYVLTRPKIGALTAKVALAETVSATASREKAQAIQALGESRRSAQASGRLALSLAVHHLSRKPGEVHIPKAIVESLPRWRAGINTTPDGTTVVKVTRLSAKEAAELTRQAIGSRAFSPSATPASPPPTEPPAALPT